MLVSWSSLGNVYDNLNLSSEIEKLEKNYASSSEVDYFKKLVNTSSSKKQPYHRWIRYREGYAGDLVKEILRRYPIGRSDIVLDPMCGSGSTLIACNQLEISSIGLDVNPYAVLASKVKSAYYDSSFLDAVRNSLSKLSNVDLLSTPKIKINDHEADVLKYFDFSNFLQLINLKREINKLRDNTLLFDFLFFALLAILEDCSNRKKDGNGLATRPTNVTNCFERFRQQVMVMLDDCAGFPYSSNISQSVKLMSALDMSSENISNLTQSASVGAIIFSPPYANSFDYFESYKIELIFGEWSRSHDLHKKRKSLIRSYRLGFGKELFSDIPLVEALAQEVWKQIPVKEKMTGKRDGRTRLVPNMLRAYFEDMRKVILDGMQLIRSQGHMHIVVDQSAYVGVPIPTDTIFAHIAEQAGYEVVNILTCRKANTSAQQLKQFPYLRSLLRETIVTIRKP